MNRALAAELIGCLSAASPSREQLQRLTRFGRNDWQTAASWLDLSGLALVFWDRLQKLGTEDSIPCQTGAALAANLAENGRRVAVMTEEFENLNRQFELAGIEYAGWKGFALVPEYCPDARLRPTYDYDYIISEDTWEGAQKALQAAGYVRKPEPGTPMHLTFVPSRLPPHFLSLQGGLYAAALPRKVEIHLSPWDDAAFRIPLTAPDRPLHRKVRRTWQGLSFYSLEALDVFVFQAMHVFQHILHNWCRLGWLWEFAYFLESRSTDLPFWERLFAYLETNRMLAEVVCLVISLAARLFHVALPAAVENQVATAMRGCVALWVDHYGLPSALDNFSSNKYSLFLYREFVPDKAAWREIRRSRLFPVHRPNHVTASAGPENAAPLPANWKQAYYVAQRLIHHSIGGAGYLWESARWDRLRRLGADRVHPEHGEEMSLQ